MEALIQELVPSADGFSYFRHHPSISVDLRTNLVQNGAAFNHSSSFQDYPVFPNVEKSSPDGDSSSARSGSPQEEGDYSDATFKYITQMLLEEDDLEFKNCMFRDCMALQAAEKYFTDVLNGSESDDSQFVVQTDTSSGSIESQWVLNEGDFESPIGQSFQSNSLNGLNDSFLTSNQFQDSFSMDQFELQYKGIQEPANLFQSGSNSRPKKNHNREDDDDDYADQQRSNKQQSATFADESEQFDMYDKVLLCPNEVFSEQNTGISCADECSRIEVKKPNKGRPRGSGTKQGSKKEMVDLRGMLTQCAQATASYDIRTANELLVRIREYSSPLGDGTERLAHYLANALEARLSGNGTSLAFASSRISAAHILKAYQMFIKACPFKMMSNIFANKFIRKLAIGAPRLHIIDFGILYGFQWPCLIQGLSLRPGGPPKLRITGIDLPQPGLRPAERVEDTGRRLEKYCKRFNVPFKFKAIAKKWETITLEDLEIERNEVLVVNSLYRLGNIPDETVIASSPRDAVLDLIRRINPNMFIHGVGNGTYNTPFFVTRFREALFHFSSMFDIFEATLPREDENRKLFEEEVLARDAMNVIACEGTERVERPETYKQWQVRTVRAGFRQQPLDKEIVKFVKNKVRSDYHKDFSVDEDGNWMLQGWKGRVIHALSCWKPA